MLLIETLPLQRYNKVKKFSNTVKNWRVFMKNTITAILAFLVGLIPGFFIVFNSVFSDSNGSLNERLFTFLLTVVIYAILGFIFAFIETSKPWLCWICLSLPGIIILVLYSFKETTNLGLNFLYACLTIISAWAGSYLRLRLRK